MNLAIAQRYADQIVPWLAPYCERIEIVGSIRRHRPVCNDVDLVCIPKTSSETKQVDLLSTEQVVTSKLRQFLVDYVQCDNNGAAWLSKAKADGGVVPGIEPKPDAENLLLILRKCQLDLWCATEQTFATFKLCRTGSKDHNIWLAQRAKDFGGHWNPYRGLELAGGFVHTASEEELYTALNLPFIAPENRELEFLHQLAR